MKKCATTNGVSTDQVIQLIKKQEEEADSLKKGTSAGNNDRLVNRDFLLILTHFCLY